MVDSRLNILVGGGFSYVPFSPGAAWTRLELVLGLIQLGHNVRILEEVGEGWCYDQSGRKTSYAASWSRQLFQTMMTRFGILDRASQIYKRGEAYTGLSPEEMKRFAADTDLLINNSGHIQMESILEPVKSRVYVDLDPVYTQLWYTEYGKHQTLDDHDVFFTVGANIGTDRSPIPDCGKKWNYLSRIVDIEKWPYSIDATLQTFTTVANWSGFGELQFAGKTFKPKYSEFLRFAELPRHVAPRCLEVVLKNYETNDPRIEMLIGNGWQIRDATHELTSLDDYQRYISRSRAEIGIAQNAYVEGNSGWFSDRSAHYLASGKPVLAQSTGFESSVPTGAGLLSFRTTQEAVEGMEAINARYVFHCESARELAQQQFDYRKVLPEALNVMLG